MADTEPLDIAALGPDEVAAGLALSQEAGWNQTAADWALMLRHGSCVALRDGGGSAVASALALPMGGAIGWLSMVLVSSAWRRRGLATRLVEDRAAWLEGRGLTPLLDATPAGEAVYARMGFSAVAELTRWGRPAGGPSPAAAAADAATVVDLPAIAALDDAVFGADRRFVLADLLSRPDAVACRADGGFLLSRPGRVATQIGPISAPDEAAAGRLLEAALVRISAPVIVDAFDGRADFAARLRRLGFTPQRTFRRMRRGAAIGFGDPHRAFAAAGPELG